MFQVLNMSYLGVCFECVKSMKFLLSVFQGFRYFGLVFRVRGL